MSAEPLCLVVSLARSRTRRATISRALDGLGIAFSFVDAIDASGGLDAAAEARIRRADDGSISDAEYACALSHALAYETFLASDAAHALVLEDDAVPSPAVGRFVREGHCRAAPMLLLFHSRARVYRHGAFALFDGVVARPLALSCTGAVAYSLGRDVAARLLAANRPVRALADWPIDLSGVGAHVLEPMIVTHPARVGGQSTLAAARRTTPRARDGRRWLRRAYVRRRWRKTISTRVS